MHKLIPYIRYFILSLLTRFTSSSPSHSSTEPALPAHSSHRFLFWQDILQPLLIWLRLVVVEDMTFGRYLIPMSAEEQKLQNSPQVICKRRRVFMGSDGLQSESIQLTKEELQRSKGRSWVAYQTWESSSIARKGNIIFIHGMGDYGGKQAHHIHKFLKAGYRVISPDLPGHARSSGLHVYIPDIFILAESIHLVISDLHAQDLLDDKGRQENKNLAPLCVAGHSLGGFTALHATALQNFGCLPQKIAGVYALSPLIQVAPESRPGKFVELVARFLVVFFGRACLTPSLRGKTSSDPRVDAEDLADQATYSGHLRMATGLEFLVGIDDLQSRLGDIDVPVRIVHGSADRVTSCQGSIDFVTKLQCEKSCRVFPGYEHVMLKVGCDEEDDEARQAVLSDMKSWFERICSKSS